MPNFDAENTATESTENATGETTAPETTEAPAKGKSLKLAVKKVRARLAVVNEMLAEITAMGGLFELTLDGDTIVLGTVTRPGKEKVVVRKTKDETF